MSVRSGVYMTISEVNKAVEDMRKIVPFEDDKTQIHFGSLVDGLIIIG